MTLGAFSISLNVKDLAKSKAFYEALGFQVFAGAEQDRWLILKAGDALVGLFEGHLQANMLTFNPGWDQSAQPIAGDWEDVRAIQARLRDAGVEPDASCDDAGAGPAHIMLQDPDGNAILIDQHR